MPSCVRVLPEVPRSPVVVATVPENTPSPPQEDGSPRMVCTGTSGFKVEIPQDKSPNPVLFPEQVWRDAAGEVCRGLANPIRTQPGLLQSAQGRLIKQEEAGAGAAPVSDYHNSLSCRID